MNPEADPSVLVFDPLALDWPIVDAEPGSASDGSWVLLVRLGSGGSSEAAAVQTINSVGRRRMVGGIGGPLMWAGHQLRVWVGSRDSGPNFFIGILDRAARSMKVETSDGQVLLIATAELGAGMGLRVAAGQLPLGVGVLRSVGTGEDGQPVTDPVPAA